MQNFVGSKKIEVQIAKMSYFWFLSYYWQACWQKYERNHGTQNNFFVLASVASFVCILFPGFADAPPGSAGLTS